MSIGSVWDPKLDRAGGADGPSSPGPVLHGTRPTGLTYEPFYGLREKPFGLSSDSRFFYHSKTHAPAFEDLLAGIRRRESLSVLTGDIGTGKTTLCRAVLKELDRKTFSAFVSDPFASREDLLKVVLMDFGVLSVDDLTSGRLKGASRTELSYLLYEFLGTLAPLQAFAVVIIDEAQNLSVPLLEEIRILSDSDGRERQLQVVLVGQLELREKLKLPEMRQVDHRVSVHGRLAPLACEGVAGYISYRLQIAGGSSDRVSFSPDAIEGIYRESGGVPRLINRICDRALHQGYLRRVSTIDRAILEASIADVSHATPVPVVAPIAVTVPVPVPVAVTAEPPAAIVAVVAEVTPVSSLRGSDPVDEWLTVIDDKEAKTAPQRSSPVAPTADLTKANDTTPVPVAPMYVREHATKGRSHFVPQTHMQKVTNRWLRRLAITGMLGLGASGLVAGATSLWVASTDWTEAPTTPDLPPARPLRQAAALEVPSLTDGLTTSGTFSDDRTATPIELIGAVR